MSGACNASLPADGLSACDEALAADDVEGPEVGADCVAAVDMLAVMVMVRG